MGNSDSGWTVLVPGDPEQLTGGYGYVREIVHGLRKLGQTVSLKGLPGTFPLVDREAHNALDEALSALPDGATAIVDGLALGGCPEPAERHGCRLNLIALVHHPLADETGLSDRDRQHLFDTECRVLGAVRQVITTSDTTASGLSRYGVPACRIRTVLPGVHYPARNNAAARTSGEPVRILCLAHLSPRKAQHQLVEALARIGGREWTCELAGSVSRAPDYAARVRLQINATGLTDQVRMTGELSGQALEQAFQRADLFVLPSLHEGYGMVIDEALAHGVPVISSDGGALSVTADRPGCVTYQAGNVEHLVHVLEDRVRNAAALEQQKRAVLDSAKHLRRWNQAALEFRQAVEASLPMGNPADGSEFNADWLALREPADHAARSRALTDQALAWLQGQVPMAPVVSDIGTGTGSNWRYLSRALTMAGIDQVQWHLFDQDAALLPAATGADIHVGRLCAGNLDTNLPRPLHLLTASALIDLVSRHWLEALADAAASRHAAVLVVLSYAGSFQLTPAHPRDDDLRHLVNQHQHGEKGTGAACGPEASRILADALAARGYRIRIEPAHWQLGADHRDLQKCLMAGWVQAAREQLRSVTGDSHPKTGWLDHWLARRSADADQGRLGIEVAHSDLLGVPPW